MKDISKNKLSQSVDKIISKYHGKPGAILGILKEIQERNKYKYLQKEILEYVAKKIRVPISKIYSIATFYAFFNLEPQGEHSVIVCRGTACHTRGSKNILDFIKKTLDIEKLSEEKTSFTTRDKKFTIKSLACFGQCALAPVMSIDGNIHSHITQQKVKKLIKHI
ncbi:MAG: NADH dehydrogenase [Elusimicrobia bacterium CG1_02_37_114]|nr:MAG: NADH dehydrogenase [Elusimicrobia bacterium CG1_02_37_114]PIV53759.1 MAG: NAD(P)H-dependent oxidoreductase subunit E [Elusimicrobia bacterium CG02_land_8_20_14_3_00_37_13]PIZ12728.1 MAG: NAD(P)H-dependent oxidoreductase subunit E [Elusimicrobia bacterium CG_4_10_14_0_8_um_filter_37_32]